MAEKQCNLIKNGGGADRIVRLDYSQTTRTNGTVTGTTSITYTATVDGLVCIYQYGATANYGAGKVNDKECCEYSIGSNANACPIYFWVQKGDVVTVVRNVSGSNFYSIFVTPYAT